MSNIEFEETIGTNHTLDSNGSKLVWYEEKATNKKPGKIIAKRLKTTMDKVTKNAKWNKTFVDTLTN